MTDIDPPWRLDPLVTIVRVEDERTILDFVHDKYMVKGKMQARKDVIYGDPGDPNGPNSWVDTPVAVVATPPVPNEGKGLDLLGPTTAGVPDGPPRRAALRNKTAEPNKLNPGALNEFTYLDYTIIIEIDWTDLQSAFYAKFGGFDPINTGGGYEHGYVAYPFTSSYNRTTEGGRAGFFQIGQGANIHYTPGTWIRQGASGDVDFWSVEFPSAEEQPNQLTANWAVTFNNLTRFFDTTKPGGHVIYKRTVFYEFGWVGWYSAAGLWHGNDYPGQGYTGDASISPLFPYGVFSMYPSVGYWDESGAFFGGEAVDSTPPIFQLGQSARSDPFSASNYTETNATFVASDEANEDYPTVAIATPGALPRAAPDSYDTDFRPTVDRGSPWTLFPDSGFRFWAPKDGLAAPFGKIRMAVNITAAYIAISINGSAPVVTTRASRLQIPRLTPLDPTPPAAIPPKPPKRKTWFPERAGSETIGAEAHFHGNYFVRYVELYRKVRPLEKLQTLSVVPARIPKWWKTTP